MSERVEVATSNCRDCGAPVIWAAYTKKDGTPTKMPFDKDPVEKGTHYLTRHSDGRVSATYARAADFPPGATPRLPHYKTCPKGKQR